jgi:hypothetical protein
MYQHHLCTYMVDPSHLFMGPGIPHVLFMNDLTIHKHITYTVRPPSVHGRALKNKWSSKSNGVCRVMGCCCELGGGWGWVSKLWGPKVVGWQNFGCFLRLPAQYIIHQRAFSPTLYYNKERAGYKTSLESILNYAVRRTVARELLVYCT